nr:PREDICTED: repetin-like [Latimeria chalumnae]|eukprot:XP_014351851.1 PREDICTED: repetin-like [Latimeria chalumnae]
MVKKGKVEKQQESIPLAGQKGCEIRLPPAGQKGQQETMLSSEHKGKEGRLSPTGDKGQQEKMSPVSDKGQQGGMPPVGEGGSNGLHLPQSGSYKENAEAGNLVGESPEEDGNKETLKQVGKKEDAGINNLTDQTEVPNRASAPQESKTVKCIRCSIN